MGRSDLGRDDDRLAGLLQRRRIRFETGRQTSDGFEQRRRAEVSSQGVIFHISSGIWHMKYEIWPMLLNQDNQDWYIQPQRTQRCAEERLRQVVPLRPSASSAVELSVQMLHGLI